MREEKKTGSNKSGDKGREKDVRVLRSDVRAII